MWKHGYVTTAPASVILIRLLVGAVFLSEGIQKFLFPDQLGAGRFSRSACRRLRFSGHSSVDSRFSSERSC
jgi:uncharacterized membrane protein YphA (DoxX/SURF4 family)